MPHISFYKSLEFGPAPQRGFYLLGGTLPVGCSVGALLSNVPLRNGWCPHWPDGEFLGGQIPPRVSWDSVTLRGAWRSWAALEGERGEGLVCPVFGFFSACHVIGELELYAPSFLCTGLQGDPAPLVCICTCHRARASPAWPMDL